MISLLSTASIHILSGTQSDCYHFHLPSLGQFQLLSLSSISLVPNQNHSTVAGRLQSQVNRQSFNSSNMKLTIAIFSLLAAVAIAAPSTVDVRSDTDPVMSDGEGGVIPYQNTGTPAG